MPDFSVSTYCFIIGFILLCIYGAFLPDPKKDKRYKSGYKNNESPEKFDNSVKGKIALWVFAVPSFILIGIGWYLY